MRVYTKRELLEQAELIGSDAFCADIFEIANDEIGYLDPPQEISTLDYSLKYRKVRHVDGKRGKWSLELTPYLAPVMAALDDPEVQEVIVPKPARTGGTVVAENYALKMMQFGPAGDITWYLAGPGEVDSYADRVFKPLFEDHEAVAAKVGRSPSDNKLTMKKVAGKTVELLAISPKTTTNREMLFCVMDEVDSYPKRYVSGHLETARQRQEMVGAQRKLYICSHPDVGWSGGVSQDWLQSSQGIFIMACTRCGGHASPYPTKHWESVKRFLLVYEKSEEGTPLRARLKRAESTAAMLCPHCGAHLTNDERKKMVAAGDYMHVGQTLDTQRGIMGQRDPTITVGFWIHGLMNIQSTQRKLASGLAAAREHFERTKKTEKIKLFVNRTMGEVFEGAAAEGNLEARTLRDRTEQLANAEEGVVSYTMGEVPDGVVFITAQVDVGGDRFDVMILGWDLQRRRYVLDRFTLKQRMHADGVWRQIAPTMVQADWEILKKQVIHRLLPLQSNRDLALPVAVTVIDIKDGNATPFGIEFLRKCNSIRWLTWPRVWGIMGARSKDAPELAKSGTDYNVDANGKKIDPPISVWNVGSWKLKYDVVETLAITDGSPGQWFFPVNFPTRAYDEFFNEVLVEDVWVRSGPNESLDLGGYGEAARQMLDPDRANRDWTDPSKFPVWARPIRLVSDEPEDADDARPAAPKPAKRSIFDRFDQLNNGGR